VQRNEKQRQIEQHFEHRVSFLQVKKPADEGKPERDDGENAEQGGCAD
jgi:hypothetical protein